MGLRRRDLFKAALLTGIASLVVRNDSLYAQLADRSSGPTTRWNRPANIAPDEIISLWPEHHLTIPKGLSEQIVQRSDDPLASDRIAQYITNPRLEIFRPATPNGAAAIIAPGGGYRYCVVDKEGYELARLLRERGVTVYVLFYRLPGDGWADAHDVPLVDAQRAVRMVRARATQDHIHPDKMAFIGFSAGGHVATSLLTRFDAAVYDPVDLADGASARPDAVIAIYPVVSMDPAITHVGSRDRLIGAHPNPAMTERYSPEQNVRDDMPPLFLLHAEDDDIVPIANSKRLHEAASAIGAAVEAHYFAQGAHGFGLMKTAGLPVSIWPELLWNWLHANKLT
ncbi:alpha/beta hydrolase [Parasphingorhabdus sp.]|uniref:alpha/beta hydrolase n=1 Tax=Parasphingorhabdus sp. TaxID=2709688 RepID=UPI003267233F